MINADLLNPAPHHIRQSHKVDYGITSETAVKYISEPEWATTKKLARSQTAGARYEARVGKYLQKFANDHDWGLIAGQWLAYNDSVAQPDFILVSPRNNVAIIFEVKLTWVDTTNQLKLYKMLLARLGFQPILGCTICKNITPETPPVIHDFNNIKDASVWQVRV